MGEDLVRAAGCVVWRGSAGDGASGAGDVEVLVVHRPAPHDDWSLPKGKLERGERHREAAVREVHEETGVRGELGADLGEVRYRLPDGRAKRVRWWALRARHDDGFEADDEVDGRRWVALADAPDALTWRSDRQVLERFVDVVVHLRDT